MWRARRVTGLFHGRSRKSLALQRLSSGRHWVNSTIQPIDRSFPGHDAGCFLKQIGSTMNFVLQPWQLLFLVLAGWVQRQQQEAIEYLRTENQVLREKLGMKRVLLSDDQRRRLAVKGKVLGRKLLSELGTVFTPDTILRWHRVLIAQKWDYSDRRSKKTGRPPLAEEVQQLVLRLARENPRWGYTRIQGALANLGHHVSDTTVRNILKANGIEPAPERKRQTTWATFLKAHWAVLAAVDFTTVEVWTQKGLVTFYLLFVMELATRRVHFAGATANPDEPWVKQVARNLTAAEEGFLVGKRYVLMDRDTKFSAAFRGILAGAGVQAVRLPARSPNLNAHLERFWRSLREECLDQMIFFGEKALRRAVKQFVLHFHHERNHQGLANRLIEAGAEVGRTTGAVRCRERLGGSLRYYYRQAA
jgi:putative transposase